MNIFESIKNVLRGKDPIDLTVNVAEKLYNNCDSFSIMVFSADNPLGLLRTCPNDSVVSEEVLREVRGMMKGNGGSNRVDLIFEKEGQCKIIRIVK